MPTCASEGSVFIFLLGQKMNGLHINKKMIYNYHGCFTDTWFRQMLQAMKSNFSFHIKVEQTG